MYTLIQSISLRRLLLEQTPVFVTSLLIAENIYKFHSFALECFAFLATWYAIDFVIQHTRKIAMRLRRSGTLHE